MSGMDLGLPKFSFMSLHEQRARTILRNVRSSGHPYVELRKDGKRCVYFCILCLSPCYSETVLGDHLSGKLHRRRLPAAKATLIGTNAWPFNDGILFFDYSIEEEYAGSSGTRNRLLEYRDNEDEDNLAVVEYGKTRQTNNNDDKKIVAITLVHEYRSVAVGLNVYDEKFHLFIPGVLSKATVSDLKIRFIGFGKRAVRLTDNDNDGSFNSIKRIWCEWLGNIGPRYEDASKSEDLDFGVVTFSYNHDLSKDGLFDNVNNFLPSSKLPELKESEGSSRKRKRSPLNTENESFSTQYDSMEECSSLLDQCDDKHLNTRVISNKALRRELRKQKEVSAGRMCPVCKHEMLPEKDAAAIMNMKTGKLACSSRNFNGAFHVFHTSCLIHWVLLCDYEMLKNQLASPSESDTDERYSKGKQREIGRSGGIEEKRIPVTSVFCPECQGSGVITGERKMEPKTCFSLSQMFRFRIDVSEARKAWIKSHEKWLLNCSVGLHFPCESEDEVEVQGMRRGLQERVSTIKLLPFFRAEE